MRTATRRLPHLNVSLSGAADGYIEPALHRADAQRDIRLTLGHFLMAPFVVAADNCVASEPRRVLEPLAGRLGLRLFDPPMPIPGFSVVQVWHRRDDADPGHRWLRALLRQVAGA